jgi:nitroreductase
MNETIKTIHSRYSCRGFGESPLKDGDIDTILQAALASPSAYNSQSWQFVVCKNKGIIDKAQQYAAEFANSLEDKSTYEYIMRAGGKIFYNAPVVVFVARPEGEDKLESINSGIAIQSMALAARSLGIDSLICGFSSMCFADPQAKAELSKQLKFPQGYICNVSILLGYGLQQSKPHEIDNSKVTIVE